MTKADIVWLIDVVSLIGHLQLSTSFVQCRHCSNIRRDEKESSPYINHKLVYKLERPCLSVCVSVRLFVCPSVCSSVHSSVHSSVCLSVCLSVRPYIFHHYTSPDKIRKQPTATRRSKGGSRCHQDLLRSCSLIPSLRLVRAMPTSKETPCEIHKDRVRLVGCAWVLSSAMHLHLYFEGNEILQYL